MGSLTNEKLIKLNKMTKMYSYQLSRARSKWDSLLDSAFLSEDICESLESHEINSEFYI